MAESKYGKYVLKAPTKDIGHYAGHSVLAHDGELNVDCSIGYHCIAEPISFDKPHAHDFVELLCFFGGDPLDVRNLGADIEICLGEEGEMHKVDEPTIVSIPANLPHCPINVKNVTRPISFLEISLTSKYVKPDEKSGANP